LLGYGTVSLCRKRPPSECTPDGHLRHASFAGLQIMVMRSITGVQENASSGGNILHWDCDVLSVLSVGQQRCLNDMEALTFLFRMDASRVRRENGFFLRFEDEQRSHIYLVTAKHVLLADQPNYFPMLCRKVNTLKGGSDAVPVELNDPKAARGFVKHQRR
jgi:hypothetical protein